jgi:hypothetical protein
MEKKVKCPHLKNGYQCRLLERNCLGPVSGKDHCNFKDHYDYVKNRQKDTPFANEVKGNMYPDFIKEWASFAVDKKSGKKRMTGGPLEKAVRQVLSTELKPCGATVYDKARNFQVWQDARIIADCLVEKKLEQGSVFQSIVSVKTYMGTEQIRETFAYAYLAKTWLGQKGLKVYQVGLSPLKKNKEPLVNACKPYLDGVYSLSSEPYFDELVAQMKKDFSKSHT